MFPELWGGGDLKYMNCTTIYQRQFFSMGTEQFNH